MMRVGEGPASLPAASYREPVRREDNVAARAREGDETRRDMDQWSLPCVRDNWQERSVSLLEQFMQKYPGIEFHMAEEDEPVDLPSLAVKLGKGTHLYLSGEFVRRMESGREEFERCFAALSAAAQKLQAEQGGNISSGACLGENQMAYWSVPDMSGGAGTIVKTGTSDGPGGKGSKGRTQAKSFRVTVSTSFSVSGQFAKLARARSKGQVKEAMGDVRQNIAKLKMAAAWGDADQRIKAARALRSLQKLLGRGARKLRRMDREELKEQSQKRAEEKSEERKARRLKEELRRMRSARLGSDAALQKEGLADEAFIKLSRPYRGEYERLALPDNIAGLFFAAGLGAGVSGGGEPGFTAGEVAVSAPSGF